MEWKKVEDELPDDGVEVIVFSNSYNSERYYIQKTKFVRSTGWSSVYDVVVWSYIPEGHAKDFEEKTSGKGIRLLESLSGIFKKLKFFSGG